MPIRFNATVVMSRATPVSGGGRYSPTIHFDLEGVADRYELTTITQAEWPLRAGESKRATFTMFYHPAFQSLVANLVAGTRFTMFEGNNEVGTGEVERIEEAALDEAI